MIEGLRKLVHEDRAGAIWAVIAGDIEQVEQVAIDYACAHFEISPEEWAQKKSLMQRADEIESADPSERHGSIVGSGDGPVARGGAFEDKVFDGIPDAVLHRFACDCAARALAKTQYWGEDSHWVAWEMIRDKRLHLRGTLLQEQGTTIDYYDDFVRWNLYTSIEVLMGHYVCSEDARYAAIMSSDCARDLMGGDTDEEWQWQLQRLATLCRRYVAERFW